MSGALAGGVCVTGLLPRAQSWVIAVLMLLVAAAPLNAADDEEKGPLADFYSYLPATPDISLPDINIPFWTDDLKKANRQIENAGRVIDAYVAEAKRATEAIEKVPAQ